MDIRHFYIEKGRGFPLLLLHGNGEDSSYFKHQITEFSRRYHVYAIDTRGHGKTPRGEKPFTIRQFAEDLLGFMDEHRIEKAHLLGFSDGGNVAMIFAIRHGIYEVFLHLLSETINNYEEWKKEQNQKEPE